MSLSAVQVPYVLTEGRAEVNMDEFVETVRDQAALESWVRGRDIVVGQPDRDPGLDGDGRYGWRLPVDGVPLSILMPGAPLTCLRAGDAHTPCLFVNGRPVTWHDAVFAAIPMHR